MNQIEIESNVTEIVLLVYWYTGRKVWHGILHYLPDIRLCPYTDDHFQCIL